MNLKKPLALILAAIFSINLAATPVVKAAEKTQSETSTYQSEEKLQLKELEVIQEKVDQASSKAAKTYEKKIEKLSKRIENIEKNSAEEENKKTPRKVLKIFNIVKAAIFGLVSLMSFSACIGLSSALQGRDGALAVGGLVSIGITSAVAAVESVVTSLAI